MPSRTRIWSVFGCTLGLCSMLLLMSAGSAFGSAKLRFVHAVPGAGPATLNVSVDDAGVSSAPVSFGNAAGPLEVSGGEAKLTLAPAGGGDALAEADEALEDNAAYTVVALPKQDGKGSELRVYRDDEPKAGTARLRSINAAPELGQPDVRAGDRVVAEQLAYGDATAYAEVPPGTYDLSVTRAGGKGGALATKRGVPLTAGTATTAIVVGSGGEPTQVLALSDGTAAPAGAPATGFGGMATDGGAPSRLLVAGLAALMAAVSGAACWSRAARR
jgi:hypothetical protein